MSNYSKLKDVHEVIDWLKASKYYTALSYDFSSEECLLNSQSINLKLFRLEIQEKYSTVFLNGENFKYALITVCQSKTDNLNELDSFTLLIKDILQSNKYKDKEYIQVKDILVSLGIHPSNFKREEKKVAKVLKQLNYKKVNRDNTKVWILDKIPVMLVNANTDSELKALPTKEEYQLCQLQSKLAEKDERIDTLETYVVELNKELQTYKIENTKLLNTTLEFANKIKELETKIPKKENIFTAHSRLEYNPLLDLDQED